MPEDERGACCGGIWRYAGHDRVETASHCESSNNLAAHHYSSDDTGRKASRRPLAGQSEMHQKATWSDAGEITAYWMP
jgi:hypothetical protein